MDAIINCAVPIVAVMNHAQFCARCFERIPFWNTMLYYMPAHSNCGYYSYSISSSFMRVSSHAYKLRNHETFQFPSMHVLEANPAFSKASESMSSLSCTCWKQILLSANQVKV